MNCTISQLHKGGTTNTVLKTSVLLLNSGYQLLNHTFNERLKQFVEQANVSESGQGPSRQGSSVKFNMQKMHFVTHEAH
jgi:hypothetical protein